jgi:hypothetical protein
VKNTKIIQHDLATLEIQVVIDEQVRTVGPSVEDIFRFLQHGFQEKVGPDVTVTVKEVASVDTSQGPRVVSKVDKTRFQVKEFI